MRLGAKHDQALATNADIGTKGRAEGGAGAAKLHTDQALFLHIQAQPAVFGGDGQAIETQLTHLG